MFIDRAKVSTRPTEKGLQALAAATSPFAADIFGLHYIQGKPLKEFYQYKHNCYGPSGAGGLPGLCVMRTGEQGRSFFLRLIEAERLGLITIAIDLIDADKTFASRIGLLDQLVHHLEVIAIAVAS